jgi:hypothetical protein
MDLCSGAQGIGYLKFIIVPMNDQSIFYYSKQRMTFEIFPITEVSNFTISAGMRIACLEK